MHKFNDMFVEWSARGMEQCREVLESGGEKGKWVNEDHSTQSEQSATNKGIAKKKDTGENARQDNRIIMDGENRL